MSKDDLIGVITNCAKLNIRESPNINANIICTLPQGSRVMIESVEPDWYFICTEAGIEGYCMRDYVVITDC